MKRANKRKDIRKKKGNFLDLKIITHFVVVPHYNTSEEYNSLKTMIFPVEIKKGFLYKGQPVPLKDIENARKKAEKYANKIGGHVIPKGQKTSKFIIREK